MPDGSKKVVAHVAWASAARALDARKQMGRNGEMEMSKWRMKHFRWTQNTFQSSQDTSRGYAQSPPYSVQHVPCCVVYLKIIFRCKYKAHKDL